MKTLLVLKRVSRQKYRAIWVGLVDQVCGYTPRLRAAISNVHHNSSAGNQKMQSSLHSLKKLTKVLNFKQIIKTICLTKSKGAK